MDARDEPEHDKWGEVVQLRLPLTPTLSPRAGRGRVPTTAATRAAERANVSHNAVTVILRLGLLRSGALV